MSRSKIIAKALGKKPKPKPRKPRDAEDVVVKSVGKEAADLTRPADISPLGRQVEGNDPGAMSAPQVLGGKRQGGNRAVKAAEKEIAKHEKEIATMERELKSIEKNNKTFAKDRDFKSLAQNNKAKKERKDDIKSLKEQIGLLKTRISGPKGLEKRYAIEKKAHGGMVQGMRKGHNDMRKAGMFYGGGMVKKKK